MPKPRTRHCRTPKPRRSVAKRSMLCDFGTLAAFFLESGPLSLDDLLVELFDRHQFGYWQHGKLLAFIAAFCDAAPDDQLANAALWMRRERAIVDLHTEMRAELGELNEGNGPTEEQITERMLLLGPLG